MLPRTGKSCFQAETITNPSENKKTGQQDQHTLSGAMDFYLPKHHGN